MPSYAIDTNDWVVKNAVWGYTDEQTHGGVIGENVTFDDDGNLVLIANGDWYQGEKKGINSSYSDSNGGKRTGAMVTSKEAYGPGSFEVVMKVPDFNGICTAIWLYNYVDNDDGDDNNYEIDIELHGTATKGNYSTITCTNWLTESSYTSSVNSLGYWLNDGNYHTFRIDWHTGDEARVEYYVDGTLICTVTTNVPDNKMYLNIGCWFPNGWCGDPAFETDYALVKSFTYTAFEGETAGERGCDGESGSSFLTNVAVPVKNLIANSSFAYDLSDVGWTCSGNYSRDDGLTFSGTLSQLVTFDCAGKRYTLDVNSTGAGTVKVTYQSIVDGVEVDGSVTASLSDGQTTLTFTPPEGCTQLKVEIIADDEVTVTNVTLNLTQQ